MLLSGKPPVEAWPLNSITRATITITIAIAKQTAIRLSFQNRKPRRFLSSPVASALSPRSQPEFRYFLLPPQSQAYTQLIKQADLRYLHIEQ